MCGIAGIVDFSNNNLINAENIEHASNLLKHRGPDDEGYLLLLKNDETICAGGISTPENTWNAECFYKPQKNIQTIKDDVRMALIHRRLSIIDTSSAGHQPMCYADKKTWITYNGEIYNYKELKQELISKGHSFTTQTDTEVILASYNEWGTECVHHFNGMWAFVIFDTEKKTLFASRDRTGVKPLYYHYSDNCFVFSSEIKAFYAFSFIPKKVNQNAAFDLLLFNKPEADKDSLIQSVTELKPSHSFILNLQSNKLEVWRYYSPEINTDVVEYNEADFQNHIKDIGLLLSDAVKLRLRADVAVGSCLSGGIDSSSIVVLMNKFLHLNTTSNNFKVFTACYTEEKFDESKWAKQIADTTATDWIKVFPSVESLLQNFDNLVYAQELPFISLSTFAQYSVMQAAKENSVKVLLDGQGGDELFGGYHHYYLSGKLSLLKKMKINSLINELKSITNYGAGAGFLIKNYIKLNLLKKAPASVQKQIDSYIHPDIKYINPEWLNSMKERYHYHSEIIQEPLNNALAQDYFNGHLKNLLRYEDRNSMHFSIEARTPFADDIELSEHLFSIPSCYKIVQGETKSLLRKSMSNLLPEQITNRKDKMGFESPNNKWMSEAKDTMKKYFSGLQDDILNTKEIMKDFDKLFNQPESPENYRIFRLLSYAAWHKKFIEN